ncbi:MAG: tRNA lysidine(34) synthetase TilS [Pseudobutyrivibrio sp.]|nr:tRNA lysidine(34) synthetase TilS [Pseudobutyrivibrio sp.]
MTIGSFLKKKKINDFINKYNMIKKGDGIVLGLSGGPDSVCLFFVLLALRQEYDLTIHAVHINHMIRGKDADEDQEFVENLCKAYQVDITSKKIDIPAMALASGRSTEEEARIARYQAFDQVAQELVSAGIPSVKIAIAHNADDNAETVLFHMARGCGLDGMCGIAPVRGNIIRPLRAVPKAEIMQFLDENGIDYCIDATNSETVYDRNKIRHNILPELSEINDKALEHITDMTERLSEVADFIQLEANGLLEIAKSDNGHIRKRAIRTAPRVISTQAIKTYLSKYMPNEKDVAAVHVENILDLLDAEGERRIDLPYKKTLIISYEEIYVIDEENSPENQGTFNVREFNMEAGMKYPTDAYTKWFDCAKITNKIVIRTRAEGDYLTINSAGEHKSIQDYFVDEKIPKHLRDSIPLVCDGSHVMWVVGHRISEYYKISNETTRIIEISYTED